MIIVRVELWSARTGAVTELARMHICNDGAASTSNPQLGDYEGTTFRGRDKASLDRAVVTHRAQVKNYPRQRLHVWHLVARMLNTMEYR